MRQSVKVFYLSMIGTVGVLVAIISGIFSTLGYFGISPTEAKETVQIIANVAATVNATITTDFDTESIERLNATLQEIDLELITLFRLYLEQQTVQ